MKTIYTIGRESECDICIPDNENIVSRRHATIRATKNGKYYLSDQSKNGTYINGIRMRPGVEVPVKRNDTISFANVADLDWEMIPKSYRSVLIIIASTIAGLLSLAAIVVMTVRVTRSYHQEDNEPISSSTGAGAVALPANPPDTADIKTPVPGHYDKTIPSDGRKAKDPSTPNKIKSPESEADNIVNPII